MVYLSGDIELTNQIACSGVQSNARCSDGGEPVACRCFLTEVRGTLIAAAILNSFQLSGSINVQDGGITLFRKKKKNMDHAAKDVCFGGLGAGEKESTRRKRERKRREL